MDLKLLTQSHFACIPSIIQPFLHAISHLFTYGCFHLNNHSPKYKHAHTHIFAIFLKLTATATHELTNPLNDRRPCEGIEANYWNAGKALKLITTLAKLFTFVGSNRRMESLKKY